MSSFSHEIPPNSIFTNSMRKWILSHPGDTQKLGKLKELTQESNSFPWRCELGDQLGLAGWGSLVTLGIPRFSHQKQRLLLRASFHGS